MKENNIQSQFNYTIDLGIKATKIVMKVKKSIKDKIINILVCVFIVLMSGLLIWDIVHDNSIVIDIIILVLLVGFELFNIIMPFIIINTQKKFLKQVVSNNFDYTLTEIDKDKCLESYYKEGRIVMQNSCDIKKLIGYEIQDNYIFLIFDNFASAIFDINTLKNISKDDFEQKLIAIIATNKMYKGKKTF